MKKKKIYFVAPKNKWGTYYYYKDISDYLIKNYSDIYDIYFCASLREYIKLHFIKTDIIFSIIPFIFKPLFTKKYIFNLHWNYKIERKNKWLWVKLLYLTELNLWFSNKIMLTSYYLSDELHFKNKYINKILIISNFIKEIVVKNKQLKENDFNFLTITSFKFYDKWRWIINLWNIIKQLWKKYKNKNINFTIVWNEENKIFYKIKLEFDKIQFPNNVNIIWKWWLNKDKIEKEFLKNNTFLYWTELDNFPWVILDALNYRLNVYVNNFKSFKYFLDDGIICFNEKQMLDKIIFGKQSKKEYYEKYNLKNVIKNIKKIIW